jgi:putative component of membrane protein insertase Oxa1/YidC/SpoIIIJ protein YidD
MKTIFYSFLCITLLFLSGSIVKAQDVNYYQDILRAQAPEKAYEPSVKHVSFLKSKSTKKLAKYNPVNLVFVGLMYTYQRFLSAQFAAECPYELSCSNFSKAAINRYGLFKGIALSADRLMRCNEFLKYDITPVNLTHDNHLIDPLENYQFKR